MTSRLMPFSVLVTVSLFAWISLVLSGQTMSMQDTPMGPTGLSIMWALMMLAMMAPAAAPSFLLYSQMSQQPLAAMAYLIGYLGLWCLVGVVYALAHWHLQQSGLLSSGMGLNNGRVAGGLLIIAGLWQWSPVKARCVARCRSPLGFMMTDWREGVRGALVMGGHYALWCIGCCWLLMTVLFVVGAMSIAWAAIISAYVLMERLLPLGRVFDRAAGAMLIVCGVWLISRGTWSMPQPLY